MGKKSKSDLPETTLENEGDPTPSRVPIFSTDDLVRFTGVSRKTLNRWIHDGLLHPKNGGVGRHIEYSVSDAIAVTAGMHFRDAGFDPGWVAASIRLLSDLGRNVIDEMEAGRTWIAPGAFVVRGGERVYVPGRLVEPPAPEHLAEAQAQLITKLNTRVIVERFFAQVRKVSEERKAAESEARLKEIKKDKKKSLAKQASEGATPQPSTQRVKPTKAKRAKRMTT